MADLLDLAEKAKCPALIFTVDMPAVGRPAGPGASAMSSNS
ncbi:hypothetical protein [Brevundimonas nasdae]|nr:hypothetical protein [Brevundimonas nasdae]